MKESKKGKEEERFREERVIEWLKDGSEQRTRRSQGARGESAG